MEWKLAVALVVSQFEYSRGSQLLGRDESGVKHEFTAELAEDRGGRGGQRSLTMPMMPSFGPSAMGALIARRRTTSPMLFSSTQSFQAPRLRGYTDRIGNDEF